MRFHDRAEAGRRLSQALERYANCADVLVLGLPRGGVPVAYEVARALHVPLDIFTVRKLGAPGQAELAMGAVASGGFRILNLPVIEQLNISGEEIELATIREQEELRRREELYRGGRPAPLISGRTLIVVDDGLATGSTMRVAISALRSQKPAKIVVAVPIAASEICDELEAEADEVICALTPLRFQAVGEWYEVFDQTTDAEVSRLIGDAA